MNTPKYEVDDFLQDESFYNWVKRKNQADIEYWEAWWNANPEYRSNATEAINLIRSISFEDKSYSKSEVVSLWNRIKRETVDAPTIRALHRPGSKGFWSSNFTRIAAVALPFILAAIFYAYYAGVGSVPDSPSTQIVVKEIPRGQKLTVYLPDGSKVKLNSESRISYPKPFDKNERIVLLNGEAFFEVISDVNRPFRVISGAIETRVLGTSFNVSAYPSDDRIEVAVVTGKVSVEKVSKQESNADRSHTGTEMIVLSPLEQAIYYQQSDQTVVSGYNPKETLAWNEGALYFNNASMEEFVTELERWYGVEIIVEREIPIKKGIVGEFRNQSLEEILMGMHVASEFQYEFKNGIVIIR